MLEKIVSAVLITFMTLPIARAERDHLPRGKGPTGAAPADVCETYRKELRWAAPDFPLPPAGDGKTETVKPPPGRMPGHSPRGEGFDGGPRRLAGLRAGIPRINFPITTKSPLAQAFFSQGVAQLHGYQFLEAERSFRKVLELDPDAGMALWGMALASINGMTLAPNARTKKLIAEAARAKGLSAKENAWIAALVKLPEPEKYIAAMKGLAEANPKDVEAQAFYAHALMLTLPAADEAGSREAATTADAALQKVFDLNPMHPAHHYRIHVWDGRDKQKAAQSAIDVGPSAPGIAHMWHMPTHHYSRAGMNRQAAWHEEAALRVDHAYMKEADVMPNEIHNYTHNATMIIDRLNDLGRAHLAYDVTANFIRSPRDGNAPGNFGVSPVDEIEDNLLATLDGAEMWDKIVELRNSPLFALKKAPADEAQLLVILARAAAYSGDRRLFAAQAASVRCLAKLADETKYDGAKREIDTALAHVAFLEAKLAGDKAKMSTALDGLLKATEHTYEGKKAHAISPVTLARYALEAGRPETALEHITPYADSSRYAFRGAYVEALHAAGKKDEAKKQLVALREKFGQADHRDRELGPQKRIAALDAIYGLPAKEAPLWRDDKHPPLSELGPLGWTPPTAPALTAVTPDGKPYALPKGKPVALIFNLGLGCVHCNRQIRQLAPEVERLRKAGVEPVVVTNESTETLAKSLAEYKKSGVNIDFPMVSDKDLASFKRFGVYDEIDREALHGMFLIDGEGKMRWRDVAPDPYLSFEYFGEEARRLLRTSSTLRR